MKSEQIKTGPERTPNRSLLYALGLTREDMDRPLIGVVCSYNEIVPGHMNLDKIADAVKIGVLEAGGYPVLFPAIAVCDGIAMGHVGMKYSLVSRDLIADSTEAMAIAHQFDGLVMIPNCDKNVPGLLMAAARLNIPTIFMPGGSMRPGPNMTTSIVAGDISLRQKRDGAITEQEVKDYKLTGCPSVGACTFLGTASTMQCVAEALGLTLDRKSVV